MHVNVLADDLPRQRLLGLRLVDAPLAQVAASLGARDAARSFAYVVTPNADHFVRLATRPGALEPLYAAAGALLLDSRVVHRLARMIGLRPPSVVTGSDLAETLLQHHIAAGEPITIVGTTTESVACLRHRYGLTRVAHFAPPFGFERDPASVEACVRFVERHAARFVFLACGAPRQELLAHRIAEAGRATGIGLCIGAAVDQLGGYDRRAPVWLRHYGLEWSWRVLRSPRRLGRRYLQDLAIVPMLLRERAGRARSAR